MQFIENKDKLVAVIFVGLVLMLIGMLTKSSYITVAGFPLVFAAWMAVGAIRKGKIGAIFKTMLALLLLMWYVAFFSMLAIDHSTLNGTVFGFESGAAIMVYVVWLGSFVVGPLIFSAFIFDKEYLSAQDEAEFIAKYETN